ncbi:uncharacterized protein [Henckelia pumila]|uniref:uncharacterized protein n=1 Tax=Henckelia pumila TaxID=405737 RepID=UPI003C6DDE94
MGDLSNTTSVEGDLKFCGNDGLRVDKAEEERVDRKAELHPHMSDSPAKIEVSGNCINLFVEVFGPLDEIDDLNSRREHLIPVSHEFDQEYALEENESVSNELKMASLKNEGEWVFNVSDLVWVKARTQTWWPGMICDPSSDAAKDATKAEKRGPLLVKYFGNPHFTWCSNSDLLPFVEYFERLSRQNDSRNFLGSVDKAVGEIGRQVKSEMTCCCFPKESHTLPAHFSSQDTEKSLTPMDNASKFDDLYLSQFKPASFCSYIRNLASGSSVPNKVELIVAKNRLSAFYCSIGHCQLPLQLLRPSCDTPLNTQDNLKSKAINEGQNTSESVKGFEKSGCDDDLMSTGRKRRKNRSDGKLISSGKESELRERKKSKYLSYPYVEGDQNREVSSTAGQNIRDDPKNLSCGSEQSTPSSKLMGKNSREKGSRNSFKGSKAANIDASSAQLLSELNSFARGCFYPGRRKYSDSLKQFYFSFRKFAFLDFEMARGILKSRKVSTGAIAKVQKKGKGKVSVKESGKNQGINSDSVMDNASSEEPSKDNQQEKGSSKLVNVKKKKEVLLSAGMEPADNLLNTSDTTTVNGSCVITFQPQGSDFPKNRTAKKRKKGEASPTDLQLETEGKDILKNKTTKKRKKGEASLTLLQLEASLTLLQLETEGSDIPKNKSPDKTRKGEASPTHLCLETQGDIPKNKTAEKREKEEASPMHLQLETQGSDIPNNETPKNENKGEASSTHLQIETQGADIPKNKTLEKRKKGEAGPMHLQLETQKNITPEKEKKGEASPTHLQFETQDSDIQKNITPEKKKKGEASPAHFQLETTARLPDLNGNSVSISVGNMPFGISAMHQDAHNVNGTERSLSSGYTATESTPNVIHNAIDLSFHNSLQKILLPSSGKPERKKWKKKKETSQVASVIPDLNGTITDSPSLEKIPPVEDHISPEGDHPRKKRRISRPNEDLGAMLLLSFALEHPLPSRETLVMTFSRFGLLKESETQFLDDSSAQIFYERTTDAQFAIRRLEKNNPFGESLISFKFNPVVFASTMEMKETTTEKAPSASTMETKETTTEKATSSAGKNHKKPHLPQPFPPADKIKVPSPQKGDAPNLTFIKKNVEMMKMTLEKAGGNLSPEMRAKLENEIKGFLNKIASMESAASP